VDTVLDGCKPEGLTALAETSCDFIDDLSRVSITRESPVATDKPSDKPTAAAAEEKPADNATSAPVEQPSGGGSGDGVKSSVGSTVEDKVCITGAVSLKVHVEYVSVSV